MATLDYKKRLQNLAARRFDPTLQKSLVTESFQKSEIPEDLKYLAESMQSIEISYNQKTITAADNAKAHLVRDLSLNFLIEYRYQGSVMTKTNIKTHSDIDLLAIIGAYYYHDNSTTENPYTGDADADIQSMHKQIKSVLEKQYDE